MNMTAQSQQALRPDIPPLMPTSPEHVSSLPSASMLVYVKEKAQWEYKVLARNLAKEQAPDEAALNACGVDGWELVGVASDSPLLYFYFKRPR
ncbi:MAG: hypothetical protein U0350_15995 [Caldilineaceae bacterium]